MGFLSISFGSYFGSWFGFLLGFVWVSFGSCLGFFWVGVWVPFQSSGAAAVWVKVWVTFNDSGAAAEFGFLSTRRSRGLGHLARPALRALPGGEAVFWFFSNPFNFFRFLGLFQIRLGFTFNTFGFYYPQVWVLLGSPFNGFGFLSMTCPWVPFNDLSLGPFQ